MLTQVKVLNARGEDLDFLLSGEETRSDPFQIKDIDGLGPVNALITTLPFGSKNGESLTGSSVGKRNIVFKIGLNPNWVDQTMSTLRSLLYQYIMPQQLVTLQFFSDHLPTVKILGTVESVEPIIFSKDPEIQVSIICPEPDFVALEGTVVTGNLSEYLTVGPDLDNYTVIDYIGTNPTGFKLEINSPVPGFEFLDSPLTIANRIVSANLNYSEYITFMATVDSFNIIEFNSIIGEKYIRSKLITTGALTSLLNTVYLTPQWAMLIPGDNRISVGGGEDGLGTSPEGLEWSLEYFTRFGGL